MISMQFKKLIREPLIHFLLIGLALFIIFDVMNEAASDDPSNIQVSQGKIDVLAANFSKTWMREPSEDELNGLIDGYIRDEVYYREALALGLDQDDMLIRRRLRQKLEFILEDVVAQLTPTDEELTVFMNEQSDQFSVQPQMSFTQVYLNVDKRDDIQNDATQLITRLTAGENPNDLGDSLMLPSSYGLLTQAEIERKFGGEFAQSLSRVSAGKWVGPIPSAFGAHVVRVNDIQPGRKLALDEARDKVLSEWQLAKRKTLQDETFQELKQNYNIVVEGEVVITSELAQDSSLNQSSSLESTSQGKS